MDFLNHFRKLWKVEIRRSVFVMGLVLVLVLVVQSYPLMNGNALLSVFPFSKSSLLARSNSSTVKSPPISTMIANMTSLDDLSSNSLLSLERVNNTEVPSLVKKDEDRNGTKEKDNGLNNDIGRPIRSTNPINESSNVSISPNVSSIRKKSPEMHIKDENRGELRGVSITPASNDTTSHKHGKRKGWEPRVSMSKMNSLLVQSHVSSHSLKPRWPSKCDEELLNAKLEIENAPIIKNDRDLYSHNYRNVSMFKKSYEMMERILKVYIYEEGEKPIFHEQTYPILQGIYASEGWFMKLMENNKQFVVKDPTKAHLFYMAFSSSMLQLTLYKRDSHRRDNLAEYLKNYVNTIAVKYPFWNRTGGADHFLVACHDWAPFETRHHMDNCIKVLCTANAARDFIIGKDTTLPQKRVIHMDDPLRNLGGKPPTKRSILAFFAGKMHGYLRPILLQQWKDDPDMKIYGEIPRENKGMNYGQYMKSSKYCICARGYEVNSPRVVEAIFYECVPVFISDNYVPPFFEVLDWEAFAVFVAEKDIPKLKDILLSIPNKKYIEMHRRVKQVQKHFLWHNEPLKYDIFHMILHSVWSSRLNQI